MREFLRIGGFGTEAGDGGQAFDAAEAFDAGKTLARPKP